MNRIFYMAMLLVTWLSFAPSYADNVVAKIGEKDFTNLQEAFDSVKTGQTIVLQGDLTQDNGVIFNCTGVSSKLDLNSHTLTVNVGSNCNYRAVRIDAGTLEVYGGTIVAVGSGTTSSNGAGCYGAFRVEANGKLNAHDLMLTNARPWGLNVKICGGEAELTNVTINSSYGGGIEVTEADLGTHSKAGKATVTDCSFTQKDYFDHCSTALSVSGGSELTVNSGTFQSDNYVIYVFSSGGYVTVNGGTYTAYGNKAAFKAAIDTKSYPNYTGGLKLNGGTFTGSFDIDSPASTVISGGNYSEDVTQYLAPGYEVVEDGNDRYAVQKAAVAKIGETKYASLAEAIAAVPTDGTQTTITMLGDESLNTQNPLSIAKNKNIVLDLNGKSISHTAPNAAGAATIVNYGTLTIDDTVGGGSISMTATADANWLYGIYVIDNRNNLIINNGTIENRSARGLGFALHTGAYGVSTNVEINGGTISHPNYCAFCVYYQQSGKQTVNITGGRFVGSASPIWYQICTDNPDIDMVVSGGEIISTSDKYSPFYVWAYNPGFDATNVKMSITGGYVDANGVTNVIDWDDQDSNFVNLNKAVISGGTFSVDPSEYVAAGYEAVENGDGTYTVQKAAVAKIGDNKYASLAEAIAAVPDGTQTTITMIGDEAVVAGVTISKDQSIILELAGHKVTGNTSSNTTYALITNNGSLIIQDNTDTNLDGTGSGIITTYISDPDQGDIPGYASNTITNHGTLTVRSGKIVNNGSGYACYAIDNQTNGNHYAPVLNIEGGLMEQMNAYTYAVRMFCNSTTNINTVNVSGGVINGGYGLWLQTPNEKANKASLNIQSGTLIARDGAALYVGGTKADNSNVNIDITGGIIGGTGVIIQGPLNGTYGKVSVSGGQIQNVQCGANVEKFITGGVYDVEPNSLYLAPGYAAALVEAENVWKVGPVTVKDLEPQGDATETAAEYKATTVVTDENNVQHEVGTNQTVSVAVVEENNVGEDVKLSDFKMNEVVTKAVVAANTEDDIDVKLIVKAAEPVVSGETVTFEVHPEAIITVNNGEPTNVMLTNDDLAEGATFTFVLDVTGRFSDGAAIKVVHKSEGYKDETFYSTVIDGKVTVSGITHFSDFELSVVGAVAQIGETEYASLADAFAAVKDGQTITMLIDVVLPAPLNVELAGKAVTLNLGTHTLTGRTNLKSGNLTLTNGNVAGGSQQALNVYGSSDSNATNYSVLTINSNVNVTADVYGVCLFGATYSTNGYGAVVNINGTVTTTGDGESGAVFVSGNLGNNVSGDMHNVVNITGTVTSNSDAGVALNGNATVNVLEGASVMGATGIAVKRGTLNMTGGHVYADGVFNPTPDSNNNGTEMTGAGISMSPTYSKYGPMSVVITGGEVQTYGKGSVALFKQAGTYQSNATFSVSGGLFSSAVPEEFCAEGYQPKYDEATDKYTVATFAAIWADKDIVLIDGQSYEYCVGGPVTQDVVVNSVKYIRYVPNANTYCAWYVPADYTLTSADLDQFNFYRINLIANAEGGNEVENTTRIWVYLFPMAANEVLTANRPYVFKTKGGTGDFTFTFTLVNTLHAPATDVRLNNSTTAHNYDFYGTYETTELSDNSSEHFFYVDYYGLMGYPGGNNTTVGPYRWYIKTTQKGGGAYYAPTFVFTDDSNVTGITDNLEVKTIDCYYDLKGMKIEKPSKGAYLVKFKDGTVKKVVK